MDKYFFEGLKCGRCGALLRFYETTDPTPICLDCEVKLNKVKKLLDAFEKIKPEMAGNYETGEVWPKPKGE